MTREQTLVDHQFSPQTVVAITHRGDWLVMDGRDLLHRLPGIHVESHGTCAAGRLQSTHVAFILLPCGWRFRAADLGPLGTVPVHDRRR